VEVRIEEFDGGIEKIVPEKPSLDRVAGGFGFTEGPV
jgi:hypothetical protein